MRELFITEWIITIKLFTIFFVKKVLLYNMLVIMFLWIFLLLVFIFHAMSRLLWSFSSRCFVLLIWKFSRCLKNFLFYLLFDSILFLLCFWLFCYKITLYYINILQLLLLIPFILTIIRQFLSLILNKYLVSFRHIDKLIVQYENLRLIICILFIDLVMPGGESTMFLQIEFRFKVRSGCALSWVWGWIWGWICDQETRWRILPIFHRRAATIIIHNCGLSSHYINYIN